jgi:hypothetical protein
MNNKRKMKKKKKKERKIPEFDQLCPNVSCGAVDVSPMLTNQYYML